ncbi:MAG: hypothetical protein HPY71_12685 [Firmicutes bacterium]|nr:hypothetical protein [Bacillota bacterium]
MNLLRKGDVDDPEFLRKGVRILAQGLMELEVAEKIRAQRYERSDECTTYRNGYRGRALETRVGRVDRTDHRAYDGLVFMVPRILVIEEQFLPRPAQMPLDVVGQHIRVRQSSDRQYGQGRDQY